MASLSVPGSGGASKQGPWGGEHGKPFGDQTFANIRQILVYTVNEYVTGIKTEYVDDTKAFHWSPLRGRTGVENQVQINEGEYLAGIEGFYGPSDEGFPRTEGSHGSSQGSGGVVIKSLTFIKNDGTKIGPIGKQTGQHFSSRIEENSKVVGFFGWEDINVYLNAIGIYTAEVKL